MQDAQWEVDSLDADAYLRRMAVTEADETLVPSCPLLYRLHRAHVATFSHENVDVILGRAVTMDVPSMQAKLIRRRRGGNCLELNLLFAALLERLGFAVTRLAGRVRMGCDRIRSRTHVVLRVDLDGHRWLVDVGFGGPGLLEPLSLADGSTAIQESWGYGLRCLPDGQWVLHSDRARGTFDLYSFTLEPQHSVDYVVANHYITTHLRSPFTGQLVAQRSLPAERLLLRGTTLVRTLPDWKEVTQEVPAEEVPRLLTDQFAIELSPWEASALIAQL